MRALPSRREWIAGGSPHAIEAAPRSRRRRVARLLGWNVLILFGLLLLAAGGAEAFLRLTVPFRGEFLPVRMVPGVGMLRHPHQEHRRTNGLDFWSVSLSNSLGFLDREPPDPARAAESCHVTFIGDSFVEGREVSIADKAQVRLEELAARETPNLDVTTSAFGIENTGQIAQLALYDAFARGLSPDVIVLVAVPNDFHDNSLPLRAYFQGVHPDYPSHLSAWRGADGEMAFTPPASAREFRANLLPDVSSPAASPGARVERELRKRSYLIDRAFRQYVDRWQPAARSTLDWLRRGGGGRGLALGARLSLDPGPVISGRRRRPRLGEGEPRGLRLMRRARGRATIAP